MGYEFHPEALEEYNETAFYYAPKEPGLDLRSILCDVSAIETIVQAPLRWPQIDEDVSTQRTSNGRRDDLHATKRYLCGIDYKRLTYRFQGRDSGLTDVSGEVAKGIIA